ncbi:MAG: hypothetical protein FD174_884 [Geobacteraceae bacterium]|nr:MAG: hypothetical protein FD174_884 [Geobacteraceae bacterium]
MRIQLLAYLTVIAVLFITSDSSCALLDTAKITIRVVDESGSPIEAAKVGIGFEVNTQKKETPVNGFTDSDGRFAASERCNGYVGFNVVKPGYYMSIGQYVFKTEKKGFIKWEPWNPEVTVILRKIENPVPMYARDTNESRTNIPVVGKDVGFDLVTFDWVKPYGKGKIADFYCLLYVRRSGPNDFEYRVKINFPGEYNGIQGIEENLKQGSEFKLPRFAPEDGYNKEMTVFIDRKPVGASKWSFNDNKSYVFRVRSEVERGRFKKAVYGKIIGDIDIGTNRDGTAYLKFKYFLNPDYTRNLEFDPKRNLFLNLPERERVGIK